MSEPKISVIIPAFNAAATIEHCLQSLLAQTLTDFEVLVVDNASTDDTSLRVERMAATDTRLHLLHESRKGVSHARNLALTRARAPYICFVDADDTVEPLYLARLASHPEADLTLCGYFVDHVDSFGRLKQKNTCRPTPLSWRAGESKAVLAPAFADGYFHLCCNKLVRRDIIEKHALRFPLRSVNEDFIFFMQYLRRAGSIAVIQDALYHWIRVEGAITGVDSMPDCLLDIYNESHMLMRLFFDDHRIADSIAFLSYELIINKYYRARQRGVITKEQMYAKLRDVVNNILVQHAVRSSKPAGPVHGIMLRLLRGKHYKLHYYLSQAIKKIL